MATHAREKIGWIDASTKPKLRERVICFSRVTSEPVFIGYYETDGYWYDASYGEEVDCVDKWRKIPDLPEDAK